jgi:hypothetical protein
VIDALGSLNLANVSSRWHKISSDWLVLVAKEVAPISNHSGSQQQLVWIQLDIGMSC